MNGLGFYWPDQVIDLQPISQYIKLRDIKTPEQFRESVERDLKAIKNKTSQIKEHPVEN